MLRIETVVDQQRHGLIERRLEETNTRLSPVMRELRGTSADEEIPVQLYAVEAAAGDPVAGLVGYVWGHWLHVDLLWVDERHRGTGLGSRLMAQAEETARAQYGCSHSRVETWDFQAPDFYQKLGYKIVGIVEDYPPGCTDHVLTKRL